MSENRLHIVTELADGTLRTRLAKCREAGLPGIPPGELVGYLQEAAEGLDFLHSRHVLHRDVKPDNILLVHGHAKVADFGLARYQEEVLGPMRTFAGTPAYMAPEMWGKEGGPASDQYSLAIAYAELRQGRPPLRPQSIPDMLVAHSEGDYDLGEPMGAEEWTAVRKALAHNPADRYPSCRAFAEAVSAVLGFGGVPRSGGAAAGDLPADAEPGHPTEPDSRAVPRPRDRVVSPDTATGPPDTARVPEPAPPVPARPAWHRVAAGVLAAGVLAGLGVGVWKILDTRGGTSGAAWHPPGTVPAEGAEEVKLANGKRVFDVVEAKEGDETVRYRLVHGENGPRVDPFHIMESKVTNRLYAAAGMAVPPESAKNGPHAPVTQITHADAEAFAAKLGGRLPTPDEWDHAAGLYAVTDRATVTLPGGTPHVNAKAPRPAHRPGAGGDVSHFDLRDMAGNGREWTSGTVTAEGDEALAIVRGRNFTHDGGLTFAHLREQQTTPHTQFPDVRSPYTGFRVVLPGQ